MSPNSETRELRLHVLDVGHGDSLLLEFPGGRHFGIVDCHVRGSSQSGADNTEIESKALGALRQRVDAGIRPEVDFVCLTHPHIDHYRGLAGLLDGLAALDVPVKEFWDFGLSARKARAMRRYVRDPDLREERDEFVRLIGAKERALKKAAYRPIIAPQRNFWRGHGVSVDVIAPDARIWERYGAYLLCSEEEQRELLRNLNCITKPGIKCVRVSCPANDNIVAAGFLIRFRRTKMILGSDVTNCTWRAAIAGLKKRRMRCEAIKVSHHGSIEGCFPEPGSAMWREVRSPSRFVAVISGGYRKGLPHEDTLESLDSEDCAWYCTGPCGGVTLTGYCPDSVDDPALREHFRSMFFRESMTSAGKGSIPRRTRTGDVTLIANQGGVLRVETEFPDEGASGGTYSGRTPPVLEGRAVRPGARGGTGLSPRSRADRGPLP
jgi:beta-lactamase superfamily II metal-dependent hydrolase